MIDQNFVHLGEAVKNVTGIEITQLVKRNRNRKYLYPRQIIQYFLRTYYGYTFVGIGELFNQHHTTVMHTISSVESMISINDPIISDLIAKVNTELMKLGHFNGRKMIQMYVPVHTDLEGLKSHLMKKYDVTFNLF